MAGPPAPVRRAGRPRPTGTGVAVLVAGLCAVALGLALGYPTLLVVGAAAVCAVAAAGASLVRRPRLGVERVIEPVRVERGMPAAGLVSVRNEGRTASRAVTAVEPVADGEVTVELPGLAAGRSAAVPYRLPTARRGALEVGPLAVVRRDLLGLWEGRRPVGASLTLWVQPRVHRLDPRPAGRVRHMEGPVSDSAPRGTLTFHSLREYVVGDDLRRVHWRTSARTGTLMVREHVDTSLPSTVVVLDCREGRHEPDGFEEAVDVAASLVASALERGFPVRLVATDRTVLVGRPGTRGGHLQEWLTTVARHPDAGHLDLSAATPLVTGGRDHDVLAVVSGSVDAADLTAVSTLARGFASTTLLTLRPQGSTPVWPAGRHLDAPTALDVLRRWGVAGAGAGAATARAGVAS